MNTAFGAPVDVGSAASPPLSLPGSHFAAGLVFLALGAAGLVWVAPQLAGGAYLLPRVVAGTHLFTLGWITTSIMGALYQFLPVALGESIRWPGVARAALWLYVPALLAFVTGLALYRTPLIIAGASGSAAVLLLFAANLAATLRRARQRDVTWWALAAACAYLVLTLVIGWALAANLRWGFMGGVRLVALATHLHVALVGWVLMVMVGVGHRLLPMFLLSHGADERPAKAAVALLAAGVALLFALHHAAPVLRWIPAGLILSGAAAFLLQARLFWTHRRRRALDPGMRLAATALMLVGSAAVAGVVLLADRLLFGATRHGVRAPACAGHQPVRGRPLLQDRGVSDLDGPLRVPGRKAARAQGRRALLGPVGLRGRRHLTLGVAALAAAVVLGLPLAARAAAVVFAIGVAVEAAQMVGLARVRPDSVPTPVHRTVPA